MTGKEEALVSLNSEKLEFKPLSLNTSGFQGISCHLGRAGWCRIRWGHCRCQPQLPGEPGDIPQSRDELRGAEHTALRMSLSECSF